MQSKMIIRLTAIVLAVFGSYLPLMAQDTPPSLTPEEQRLYDLIMQYRSTKGLPSIPLSPSLTFVAQQHVKDLNQNRPFNGSCNMHSWSAAGKWSSCCYTSDHKEANCMWNKPKEMTGYPGNGYEIAHGYSNLSSYKGYDVNPSGALESWQNSPGHHAVMINSGMWSREWKAIGIGMYKDFAVVWFGHEPDNEPFRVNAGFTPPATPVKEPVKTQVIETPQNEEKVEQPKRTNDYERPNKKSSNKSSSDKSPRFAFEVGGGLNYMLGSFENEPEEYGFGVVSGQAEAMLGVRLGSRPYRKAPIFGVFATYGFNSNKALPRYFSGTVAPNAAVLTDSTSNTLEIEAGFLVREWLRISGGVGETNFKLLDGSSEKMSYYTTTVGAQFGTKNVRFFIRNTFLFGKDAEKIMFRPAVGLLLHLHFLKI